MSTAAPGLQRQEQQKWFQGIDLYSRVSGPIAKLTLLQKSLLFAELSQIAYMPPEPALVCARTIGFPESLYFDREGAQAYWFGNRLDSVVVCRGTEPTEWSDVKADANAFAVLAETVGRVHSGFKREVDTLWPMLEPILERDEQPLWFAGHSLGGAMATVLARRWMVLRNSLNSEGLFTYGSPRVGDRAYLAYCRPIHFRWVNNNDIVTRVPPTWFGYRHSGIEMYIDSQGHVRPVNGWRRVMDRLRGFLRGLVRFKIDQFSDHSIEQYIAHIHVAVQQQSHKADSKLNVDARPIRRRCPQCPARAVDPHR